MDVEAPSWSGGQLCLHTYGLQNSISGGLVAQFHFIKQMCQTRHGNITKKMVPDSCRPLPIRIPASESLKVSYGAIQIEKLRRFIVNVSSATRCHNSFSIVQGNFEKEVPGAA